MPGPQLVTKEQQREPLPLDQQVKSRVVALREGLDELEQFIMGRILAPPDAA